MAFFILLRYLVVRYGWFLAVPKIFAHARIAGFRPSPCHRTFPCSRFISLFISLDMSGRMQSRCCFQGPVAAGTQLYIAVGTEPCVS